MPGCFEWQRLAMLGKKRTQSLALESGMTEYSFIKVVVDNGKQT